MRYLYRFGADERSQNVSFQPLPSGYEQNILKIRSFRRLPGEEASLKSVLVKIIFQIITFGRARIVYVTDNGNVVHTSYLIPKCIKFPFLCKGDYEIGPCYTAPSYRGRGIYPAVLRYICTNVGNDNTNFYMIVSDTNAPSVRGIEKASFSRIGYVRVSRFKRYYLSKE